jgi:hypothetical protein
MQARCSTLPLQICSWLLIGWLAPSALRAQILQDHHIHRNDGCYNCGYTTSQSPTDPSQRCIGVADGEEGMGTSCSEYLVADGWVCTVSNNPCYNVVVHASLARGSSGERAEVGGSKWAATDSACTLARTAWDGARPAR